MTLDAAWKELLPRLEAELSARQSARFYQGDDDAWVAAERLLRMSARFLRALFRATPEDTDDVVQETILKLQSPRIMQRLRAAGSPAGYVLVMMRNALSDLAKRRLREIQPEEPFEEMIAVEVSEEEGKKAEDIERMKEALKSLRPEDRYLLRMRFWKGMRVEDISEVIGVSYSATAVRLFRILSRLREAMGR